jgi:hypothetical protein
MAGAGVVLEEYGISQEKGHDFSMSGGNAFWSLFMGDKLVSKLFIFIIYSSDTG